MENQAKPERRGSILLDRILNCEKELYTIHEIIEGIDRCISKAHVFGEKDRLPDNSKIVNFDGMSISVRLENLNDMLTTHRERLAATHSRLSELV